MQRRTATKYSHNTAALANIIQCRICFFFCVTARSLIFLYVEIMRNVPK